MSDRKIMSQHKLVSPNIFISKFSGPLDRLRELQFIDPTDSSGKIALEFSVNYYYTVILELTGVFGFTPASLSWRGDQWSIDVGV
jgi:hypothetical protein